MTNLVSELQTPGMESSRLGSSLVERIIAILEQTAPSDGDWIKSQFEQVQQQWSQQMSFGPEFLQGLWTGLQYFTHPGITPPSQNAIAR
jgi:hypothetical protein